MTIKSQTPVTIRHIDQTDHDALRALYIKSLKLNKDGFIQDLDFHGDIAARAVQYQSNNGLMIGAFDGDQLIGCGGLVGKSDTLAELGKLHLDPAYQGRGLGRMMAEHILTEAENLGYDIVDLHVTITQEAAIGLYRKLGFTETKREVFEYADGTTYDTIFMEYQVRKAA